MPLGAILMQQNYLFTPSSSPVVLVMNLPNNGNIHSIWVPAPTTGISFAVPNGSSWTTFYAITVLSAESIPLDQPGYTSIQVSSNGNGDPFWIIISDQYVSPYKANIT
jgi:hypothetical protein